MATKQSKKATPKAAKATGSKSKTAQAKSADAEGTKSKTSKSTSAQAADGKTKTKAKSTTKTAEAKRKPAHTSASDSKTSATKAKKTPAQSSHAKTAHRKSAAHQSNGRQKGANGRAGGMAVRPTGTKSRVKSRETQGGRDLRRNQAEPSVQTDQISSALFQALESHATTHNLGHVARDSQFDWGEVENPNLRPDLAFISFDRWAAYRNVPTTLTWHVVPDLVVEFITEDEKTEEFGTRLDDYFKAGVSRVWVVYPDLRIFDYQSPSEYQILNRDQAIDGGTMLPGFQLPIKELAEEK
jgi:hypothetical protein